MVHIWNALKGLTRVRPGVYMMHDRGRHIGWVYRREVDGVEQYGGPDKDREWLLGMAPTLAECATALRELDLKRLGNTGRLL